MSGANDSSSSSARGERAEGELTSPAKRAQARKQYEKQPGAGGASSNSTSSSSSSSTSAAAPASVPTVWSSNLAGTHLYFSSPPSLSLEMLRQSMSEYLRTQVCFVHLVVVLYGFNDHDYGEDEEIPINEGRLCYVCLTQSEMILVDKSSIGFLASSVVIPTYDDLLPPVKKKKGATVINVPYYFIEELVVDPEREDFFQLLIAEKPPRPLPTSFILSSVHRKAISENLQALYNNHFLYASVWNSDINPHPYVEAAEGNRAAELEKWQKALALKRKKKAAEKADKDPDDASSEEEDDESDKPLTGNFSVLTLSASDLATTGQIPTLPITFQESDLTFQHPSEQFFQHLPPRYENMTKFHRCGYVWSTNVGWSALDTGSTGQAALNRSTGTYIYKHPEDESTHIAYANRKQLLVTFLPELSVSTHTSLLQCRDAKGSVYGRKCGKMSLKELLRFREESHDTDFFMWCESVGRSVAMHSAANAASPLPVHDLAAAIDPVSPPSSPQLSFQIPPLASTQPQPPRIPPPDYFVAQSIIHTRKVNVVGDKATVICFKMHCYTSEREIGLVGIRRKFIPPCCDTFQDILFVLYGPAVAPGEPLQPNPGFMFELESMVDTLSPTVVPLPYHYAQRPDLKMIHPTYVDPLVMQARMNALLYSQSAYNWFQTRRWINSTYLYNPRVKGARHDHHNLENGLVPTTEFLGAAGYKLAVGFANAILVRVSHREERQAWSERMANVVIEGIGAEAQFENEQMMLPNEGVGGGAKEEAKTDNEGDKNTPAAAGGAKGVNTASLAARALLGDVVRQSAVDDPMDIVERMCTEFFAYENSMRENGMKPSVQKTTYSAEEEWRCRVSQYLAYAVDDGIFPSALNIRRLLNVITGNMVKAPLISYETAGKLEKVVDFLLYLKKRCGPPLQLPSLWSEEKAAAAAQASSMAAKLKPNNKRPSEIATVFASLASAAPASVVSEGKPASYDWDSKTSLLHKFRDISLMLNFTCNENVMVHLLDANYVEYLENAALGTSDHSDLSVLPQLLTSLLQKDYNIALVRAVCDKIIVNQIQYDGFIPALLALAKDGSLYASIYSLRALTFLARTFPLVIYEYGGVSIGMWHICYSKNEDLLDAAIDMVLELVTNQNIHIFGQSGFIKKLVDILRPRVGLQLRYRSALLQKTCSLILKFAQVPSLLTLCLTHYCHKELIDILAKSNQYQPILLHVTACMGQLYVNAGSQIMGAPSEKMVEDATVLVRSLNAFNSREQLRLCLNILIVLQYLLRLPKGYYARLSNTKHNKVTGAIQFTAPDPAFEKRMNVLQHLTQDESLDSILDELLQTALNEEERTERELQLSGTIQIIDGRKVVTSTPDEMQAGQKDDWLLGRRMVAKNVKEKTKWFRTRINFSKTADFNVKAIWQKDNNKQFLAIPKV